MEKQPLMDKLSEFLMVEQGGLQLYRVAAERCTVSGVKQQYVKFGDQTSHHRLVLVELIQRLGGDPSYISPTARIAQFKAAKLLESSFADAGLSPQEIEANDLENVLLAETKDHADWSLLKQITEQITDATVKQALQEAVDRVEPEEDEHVEWCRETLSQVCLQMLVKGPAPSPERWQSFISAPEPPIKAIHAAPMREQDGLLPDAMKPQLEESPIVRAVRRH